MMRSLIGGIVVLVMMLTLVPSARGQGADTVASVARFVGDSTIGVIRADMSKLDFAAGLADLIKSAEEAYKKTDPETVADLRKKLEEDGKYANDWRDRFIAAGGKEIYLVAQLNIMVDPPFFFVVPTTAKTDQAALLKVLKEIGPEFGEAPKTIEGAIAVGPEELFKGLPLEKATRTDEIVKALRGAGEAPVQLALIPSDLVRRAVAQIQPELPEEIGGGPISIVTDGAQWGSAYAKLPPGGGIRFVFHSTNAEAATKLEGFLNVVMKKAADLLVEEDEKDAADLLRKLKPSARDNQVQFALEGKDFENAKQIVITAMMKGRRTERMYMVTANMRQILIACKMYQMDHKDEWPKNLDELAPDYLTPEDLINPANPTAKPGYIYRKPSKKETEGNPSKLIVLYEPYKTWPKDGLRVGYADGHVSIVKDEETFKKQLEGK